jgi:arylsulfatase A-like enzyme
VRRPYCSAALVLAAHIATACSKDAARVQPAASPGNEGNQSSSAAAKASSATQGSAPVDAASPATAPSSTAVAGPPKDCNVVLLSIDSLRADMPWAGYPRAIAPHLTEFEKSAVSYTKAYSVSSYTSMSLGGLLGGRLPSELRRSGYFFGTYQRDVFFPKLLQQAGIHTMGVMAHMYFKAAGFEQGFDDWQIVPGVTFDPNTDRDVTSPQSEESAEKLLGDAANASRRFFFWAHFLDPHDLYMRHQGIDWGSTPRDRYDGEVTFTDGHVGKLLDFIASQPWVSRTVVIVTSDHGEEFNEHGMTRHGFELWQTLVRVPLMIRAPGAGARHVDVPRSAIDLAPTILELFGVAPDPSYEGKSLVAEVYGGPAEARDVVVDLPMTSDNAKRRALIHGDSKLLCFDNDSFCKLFDVDKDPLERSPIKGGDLPEMRDRYEAVLKRIKEVPPYACTAGCLNNGYKK